LANWNRIPGKGLQVAGLCLVALLAVANLVAAACPYPLGDFVAGGFSDADPDHVTGFVTHTWGNATVDPEWAIVEATHVHGQKNFGMIVNAGGQLHFVYNAEVEWEDEIGPQETQSTFYKAYSPETGWDVPIQYIASQDTTNEFPEGRNVAPYGTALGNDFWAVWEISGAARYRQNGSYIVARGKTATGFTPFEQLAHADFDSANKIPKIITVGSSMYVAFQTNAYQTDTDEFQMVGRTWDGTTAGPYENISGGNDGWSDQVVSLATDGSRLFAVWASRNTTDFTGTGTWVLKGALRDGQGHWGSEIAFTVPSGANVLAPSAAFFDGKFWVAWATDDLTINPRGDVDAVLQSYDPSAGTMGPILSVTGPEFTEDEESPVLLAKGGALHIVWASSSSPSSIATSGTDSDIYYRSYTSAGFSPIKLVSDPLDSGYQEHLPGFFTEGDAVYAFFTANICLRPACHHETDWREMTRLVARPAAWYDDVTVRATFGPAWPTAAGSAVANLTFYDGHGAPVASPEFGSMTALGLYARSPANSSTIQVTAVYNGSLNRNVWGTYCGKPLPTTEEKRPVNNDTTPTRPSPVGDVVLPALLAATLMAAAVGRRYRRGPD
jgi:hypothetical protein